MSFWIVKGLQEYPQAISSCHISGTKPTNFSVSIAQGPTLPRTKKDEFRIPKTREPWAMPHYRPHSPVAFLALLLAGREEALIPIPLSSHKYLVNGWEFLCLFFTLHPFSSIFLLAACVAAPCLCLLPPFITTGAVRRGAAASTQPEQAGPSLALCRGLLLYGTPASYHISKQPVLGMANDFHQSHL